MKKLYVTMLASMFAVGIAYAEGDKQKMEEGKQEMQEQSEHTPQVGLDDQVSQTYNEQLVSVEDAKEIQEKLSEKGHYQGEIDGIIGEQTNEALKAFNESEEITADNPLNQETIDALGVDVDLVQAQEEDAPKPEKQEQQESSEQQQESSEQQEDLAL